MRRNEYGLALRGYLETVKNGRLPIATTDIELNFDSRLFCGLFLRLFMNGSLLFSRAIRILSYRSGMDGGRHLGARLWRRRADVKTLAAFFL